MHTWLRRRRFANSKRKSEGLVAEISVTAWAPVWVIVLRCTLIIEERELEAFDEEAVAEHLATQKREAGASGLRLPWHHGQKNSTAKKTTNVDDFTETPSELTQWPVQFALVNPKS